MPNLPIRGLGKIGVISDANPYDLPLSAWSNSRNIRFDNDGATRSSVFKPFLLQQSFISPPVFTVDDSLKESTKAVSTFRADGTITRVTEGAIKNVSPTPPLPQIVGSVTGTTMGSICYVNTQTDAPVSIASGEATYVRIPNWASGDRCRSLRGFRDFLIALYVTKNNAEFPNMVKWSDATSAGVRPRWDVSAENGLAGENVLNGSTGYLVDGMELGNSFLIYGTKEVFRMNYIGAPMVFNFEKLFNDFSIMGQNCIVAVGSKHYVLCEDDIVVTDGVSRESICDNKVRRTLFGRIDFGKRNRCIVIHNANKSEIIFAYPSNDSEAAWGIGELGCNEAAVFNYLTGAWSFIDLPNVTHGAETSQPQGTIGSTLTWEGLAKWSDLKVPWSFSTYSPMSLILTLANGPDGKQGNVVFYDDYVNGRIDNEADQTLIWPAWCETKLIDFDDVGFPLNTSKLIQLIIPQVSTGDTDQHVLFYVRGEMLSIPTSGWNTPITFDPSTQLSLSCRASGRYFSLRFEIPERTHARLSGFDLGVRRIAGR